MKRGILLDLVILSGCLLFVSCNNTNKPVPVVSTTKKAVLMEPFRFHKLIEVSPGQDYDVFSWGRGPSNNAAFEILHSDSAAAKYTTTTGDITGNIVDVFNTDMDLDGNPEIIIQAKGTDTINYTHMYAFEFNNSKAAVLDFPKLTKQQRQGYRGGDNFYVQDGKLVRIFPVYDANAKSTTQKRQLEYSMRDNELFAKQLSNDSTHVKPISKALTTTKTDKPKHHETPSRESRHRKKHRRHHHEDD